MLLEDQVRGALLKTVIDEIHEDELIRSVCYHDSEGVPYAHTLVVVTERGCDPIHGGAGCTKHSRLRVRAVGGYFDQDDDMLDFEVRGEQEMSDLLLTLASHFGYRLVKGLEIAGQEELPVTRIDCELERKLKLSVIPGL